MSTLATKGGHPDSWGICHLLSLSAGPGWGGDLLGTVLGPAWVTLLLTDGSPRQMTLVAPPEGSCFRSTQAPEQLMAGGAGTEQEAAAVADES